MQAWSFRFLSAVSVVLCSSVASAHFDLIEPKPSDKSTDGGKGAPPCGPAADSGIVTAVTGGSELTISVNETISHPGFYRIALALKDRSELPEDNVVRDKDGKVLMPLTGPGSSATADFQATPKFPVLADNLWPHTNGTVKMFTHKLTLPNVNCDKCTLQVIEFMAQHGPDYFYRHCADLKITADPSKPIFDPSAPAGGGGGAAGAGGSGAGGTGGASGGTGGTPAGGVATGGTAGSSSGGASSTSGSSATSGAPAGGNATGGSGTAGASAGTSQTAPAPSDDGGCSVSGPTRGAASLLAALGLGVVALGRRRRAA
ncbi:MAG: hypothetical protein K0R38_7807 [Polyangiaceae bacterium]|jgi:uncharacterized protein (TIGR03382 family)|nr:hypothetical protein [Polyangiaceae bacterium]